MRIGIPMKSLDAKLGGPGTYTRELVSRMVRIAGEDEFVLIYPQDVSDRIAPPPRLPAGLLRAVETGRPRGVFWDQVVVPQIAKRENIDVFFGPFMSIPVRGRFGKVFTVHGAERHIVPDMLPPEQRLKWIFMEKVLVRLADRVIAVSETMARDFANATGCRPDKLRAIHLGVADRFRVVDDPKRVEATRKRYGLGDEYLLFVGRIFPNKNFANVVKAFGTVAARIPHRLVVVGGVRWKYEEDVDLIRRLGLGDRVDVLDFVPEDDLVHLYNMATCLIYASFYESFGLTQLEAMACGCPVIAARTGALPEVAGDAAVYCRPDDPDDIAAGILRLIGDPSFRAVHIAKGLARAKYFTWDRCATQTLELLREVNDMKLNSRPRRAQSPRRLIK